MNNEYENYLIDALDMVSAWDLPDEDLADAVNSQARLLAGLYPEDELQALYCDEPMDAIEDLLHRIVATFGLEGGELKQAREELAAGWLKTFVLGLDDLLARGGGRYFADNRLTVADLKVFVQVRSLLNGTLDHVPADFVEQIAPALVEHCNRIGEEPIVTAYYASRSG